MNLFTNLSMVILCIPFLSTFCYCQESHELEGLQINIPFLVDPFQETEITMESKGMKVVQKQEQHFEDQPVAIVYPNPVGDQLILHGDRNFESGYILNSKSKVVVYIESNTKPIKVSRLHPGEYQLVLKHKKSVVVRKFLKE